jgi:hypothetical protein
VHWNPWYSTNALYIAHQTTEGVGFVFARTDWYGLRAVETVKQLELMFKRAGNTCSTRSCLPCPLGIDLLIVSTAHATAILLVGSHGCVFCGVEAYISPNVRHAGIGADCCQNASVWVDSADPWGVLITNG